MNIDIFSSERPDADLLVVPCLKGMIACLLGNEEYELPIHLHDFEGKEGETLIYYPKNQPEVRVCLLGLGDKDHLTVEKLRRSYGLVSKMAAKKKWIRLNILKPLFEGDVERGVIEGLLLPGQKDILHINLIGKWNKKQLDELKIIFDGVELTRELINGDADLVTPTYLATQAKKLAKGNLSVKVLDEKEIAKEGLGLVQAVARGSHTPPRFIIMEYKGKPKDKETTVLIGKGVTYDTGGLNLKSSGMEEMKADMGGAGTLLGVAKIAEALKLKINLTFIIPSVENAIGPDSFKPGSVYKSYSGKTVEIGNTDAEGRLILADAITYAQKHYKPKRIIDLATLTGAMTIILGPEGIGLFSNDDALADSIILAGSETYERCFRLPLIEEYRDILKSEQADIKNWNGRVASSTVASVFLKEFIENDVPWAHLDIATTTFWLEGKKYYPKYATGIGVRLMIDLLKSL